MLNGWELPTGESDNRLPALPTTELYERAGDAEGIVYAVSLFADSKNNLDDLTPPTRVEGIRVPDLAQFLLTAGPVEHEDFALRELQKHVKQILQNPTGEDAGFLVAIRDQPAERTNWGVYSDWLQEHDLPPAGLHLLEHALRAKACGIGYESRKPELDLVRVTPHAAQACKHRARFTDRSSWQVGWDDYYAQFIFFNDRWAAAHPTLAAGILTFASRWDVLS